MTAPRRVAATALFLAATVLAPGALPPPAHAEEDAMVADTTAGSGSNVEVTRVTLATGGLAEVEGLMVEPAAEMRIAVERALVADVLRTLLVTGQAQVRSIDLPAAEPVGERSATGRLLDGDLSDPATVLDSLIGEGVTVRGGAAHVTGRLLAHARTEIPGGEDSGARPAIRVAVATEDGRVAYATFETLGSIAIGGDAADARMAAVVPALRESVEEGRRSLRVRLDRTARAGFSFVVPTTVWRPSYRAVLEDGGEVALQGWATLENTTGLDWNAVALRLSVGVPVAYRQDVYAPLRTTRPEAPFEVGRTAEAPPVAQDVAPAPAPAGARAMRPGVDEGRLETAAAPPAGLVVEAPSLTGSAATVFAVAGPVDLAAGRTLSVPFLEVSEGAQRIAYLDLGRQARPLDALELAFGPDATVPGGLIAVYEGSGFVGDARFAGADGGERTILPFALSAHVNASVNRQERRILSNARFSGGLLRVTREARRTIVVSLEAREPVALVVDVPRAAGETIAAGGPADVTVTEPDARLARLRLDLAEGATRLEITGTRPIEERYEVGRIPPDVVEEVLSVGGAVDDETAERLSALAAAAARIDEIDRRIETMEATIDDLREAVAADRENLSAIDVATPEGARVRERIVERTEEIDGALGELRALREERLELQDRLRRP